MENLYDNITYEGCNVKLHFIEVVFLHPLYVIVLNSSFDLDIIVKNVLMKV